MCRLSLIIVLLFGLTQWTTARECHDKKTREQCLMECCGESHIYCLKSCAGEECSDDEDCDSICCNSGTCGECSDSKKVWKVLLWFSVTVVPLILGFCVLYRRCKRSCKKNQTRNTLIVSPVVTKPQTSSQNEKSPLLKNEKSDGKKLIVWMDLLLNLTLRKIENYWELKRLLVEYNLGAVYMIPICRDAKKRGIVLMYWKLS